MAGANAPGSNANWNMGLRTEKPSRIGISQQIHAKAKVKAR